MTTKYNGSKSKLLMTILVFVICSIVSFNASAQSFSLGIKYGVNVNRFAGDKSVLTDSEFSYNYKNGHQFGALLSYKLSNTFSLTGEINYVMKGTKNQNISDTEYLLKDIRLNYLEIPVLIRFHFLKNKSLRPNIFIGSSVNFLVSAIEDRHWINLDAPAFEDPINWDMIGYDATDLYESTEVSFVTGIGFQHAIKEDMLVFIDFRFCYGLTDIQKDLLLGNQTTISMDVGITFPF